MATSRRVIRPVESDEEPVEYVIDAIGDDRLIFSSDFPHGDSKLPRAVEPLSMTEPGKRKILRDNCAEHCGRPA